MYSSKACEDAKGVVSTLPGPLALGIGSGSGVFLAFVYIGCENTPLWNYLIEKQQAPRSEEIVGRVPMLSKNPRQAKTWRD